MKVSGRWAPMGFGDEAPFLAISEAALAGSEQAAREHGSGTVSWEQFRPTIVIGGAFEHAEDYWKVFSVGGIDFSFEGRCDRCQIIHTNQHTAHGLPKSEPMRTLKEYRSDPEDDPKKT